MWVYRYGEISYSSAVSEGTIHAIQGLYVNWRELYFGFQLFPFSLAFVQSVCITGEVCFKIRYFITDKGRKDFYQLLYFRS